MENTDQFSKMKTWMRQQERPIQIFPAPPFAPGAWAAMLYFNEDQVAVRFGQKPEEAVAELCKMLTTIQELFQPSQQGSH